MTFLLVKYSFFKICNRINLKTRFVYAVLATQKQTETLVCQPTHVYLFIYLFSKRQNEQTQGVIWLHIPGTPGS